MDSSKIVEVTFLPPKHPKNTDRFRVQVVGKFDNGSQDIILNYYPDELRFYEYELVGKTQDEVIELFNKKDMSYLRAGVIFKNT